MTTRFRLSDGRLVSHEVGVYLPTDLPGAFAGEFLPPYTLHRFGPMDLEARGITVEELEPETPPAVDLENLRQTLLAGVDAQAETERLRYITSGAGMAMTYQEKLAQARAALADVTPTPGEYPLLEVSVGIEAESVAEVAALVVGRYSAWVQIGAAIEGVRLAAKKALAEAATEAEIRAAANVTWPAL